MTVANRNSLKRKSLVVVDLATWTSSFGSEGVAVPGANFRKLRTGQDANISAAQLCHMIDISGRALSLQYYTEAKLLSAALR